MRRRLEALFRETLGDIAVDRIVPATVRLHEDALEVAGQRIPLPGDRPVVVFAIGKAAAAMVRAFGALLDGRAAEGILVVPAPPPESPPGFEAIAGSHPCPDQGSLDAAAALLARARRLDEDDLVVHLISGGGSALAEAPIDPSLSLAGIRAFYELLVTCGADIVAMNVLRKHFSALKGGRLALAAAPARQLTLYVSDVPSAHPSAVASGPTMPDESTLEECVALVESLGIADRLPAAHRALLEAGRLPETPKPGDPIFDRCRWHRLIGTEEGVEALAGRLREDGFDVRIDLSVDDLPVDEALDRLLAGLEALRRERPGRAVALVSGGELSCPVTGDGRGGRNQAFVLRAVERVAGSGIAVLSGGTDGVDGNSPAAGAVADGTTFRRATALGMDPADFDRRSDSWSFFHALGDAIETGPTGNNVRDLRVLVAES